MPETQSIPVADLWIDVENPRLLEPSVGQREAQREVAKLQQKKLVALAQDIISYGLNPSDLPIVTPFQGDTRRFAVLDGNRRLIALKALENPDSMVGALTPANLNAMRKLSAAYQQNPIEEINCLIVTDRKEAEHWMDLRHLGELEGAGIVRWGADEKARYRARNRGRESEPHSQALDYLEERGDLSPDLRRKVPTTSFKRLIDTAEVRAKLGIDVKDKKLVLLGKDKQVAKALMHVVNDLASGQTSTKDIYHKPDRIKYADNLPANIVVAPATKGKPVSSASATGTSAKPPSVPSLSRPKQRDKLIPRDCALNITDARIRRIEAELRNLSLENYVNAVSVLFRVFIELSCDDYLTRAKIPIAERDNLSNKLNNVSADLVNRNKMTKPQAAPVRRFAAKDSFLAPSMTYMHGYVHNQHIFPAPGDLRVYWDNLQPFMIAIWSA